MKRLLLATVLSAIAVLLISCGGNRKNLLVGSNGQPLHNAKGCDTSNDPSCTVLMVTQSDGTSVVRYYVLHIPPNFPATSGALVVALHGTGESALEYPTHTLMNNTADADGFAVVYPEALDAPRTENLRQWNGYFNGAQSPTSTSPDDVSFLRQLITTLQVSLNADPKKIYVMGISSGGLMAVRVGVELSDLVAAIAPLSGALDNLEGSNGVVPAAAGPVSVLMLHADMDQTIPYCGTRDNASQDVTVNYWLTADATVNLDTSTPLCNGGNPTSVNEKDGTGGLSNTEVKFYRLIGADHFAVYNNADLSRYNPNFNSTTGVLSNDIVWKFFAAHPKQ
ncbi:MAG TPA: alpha/beta fold hydrolase [Terriglobales bacterium]|jgi:polyhydroxybutyrate depolymerase|nr:alpha/beta fold hydrolase [Terriglobales bacterium]